MFKRSKEPEKKGSEKREDLLVSFWKVARFVFAIIQFCKFNRYQKCFGLLTIIIKIEDNH